MAGSCCWGMLLVVHHLLGWSTALVAAHPHIPAGVLNLNFFSALAARFMTSVGAGRGQELPTATMPVPNPP
jgi:hypothetical protein